MLKKIFYISILLVGIYLIINLGSTTLRLWQRQNDVTEANLELEKLKKENKDLVAKLEYTQSQEFLEKETRETLGLVLPGEKKVIIGQELLQPTESGKTKENSWFSNWGKWLRLFF